MTIGAGGAGAEVVLIEFVGDAKSSVAASEETVAGLDAVTAAAERAGAATAAAGKEAAAAGKQSAAAAGKAAAAAKASSGGIAKSFTATGASMSKTGKSLTKWISLPLLGVGAIATKMSLDFSKAMLLIETHTDTSRKMVERYRKSIMAMSASGNFTQGPKELAEAMYHVASDGYKGSKALDVLRQSAHLATIGQSNLAETTYALVSAEKTGIRGTQNLHEAIGLLNGIVGAGDMKMQDLVGAMSTGVLPAAKSMGLSLKDVGAALDVMTQRGQPAQQAAYRLRMNFAMLSPYTEKAQKEFEALGLGQYQLVHQLSKPEGLLRALEMLKEHLSGLGKYQQNLAIQQIFGGGRSSTGMLILLQNLKSLEASYHSIGKLSGETNKNLAAALRNPANVWAKNWAQLQGALVEVGNELVPVVIPALKDVAHALTGMAHSFEALSPGMRRFIIDLGVAAIAAGPLLRIVGGLTKGLGGVASLGSKAAGAIGGLGAADAGGAVAAGEGTATAAAVSQPEILAAVAGAAALTAGLIVLYKHSREFRREVAGLGHSAKAALDEIEGQVDPLIQSFGHLGSSFNHLHGPIGAIGAVMKGAFVGAFRTAFKIVGNVIRGMGKIFSGEVEVIRGIVNLIADLLEGKFGRAWKDVTGIFRGGAKMVVGVFDTLTAQVRPLLGTFGSMMSGAFTSLWADVKGIFTSGVNEVIGFINDLIEAINVIPGIPNIGTVGAIGGGGGGSRGGSRTQERNERKHGRHTRRARGGPISEGAPSGDTVPALLERGEYVLNRKAVARVGKVRLDALNFHEAPRFAFGGPVGEAVSEVASAVGNAASGTLGGALSSLPTPHLPAWISGVGSYLLKEVKDYVTSGFQSQKFGHLTMKGAPSGPVPPGSLRSWLTTALKDTRHFSAANLSALFGRAMQESGGNPHAINLWDSNAAAGHPSKGLLQTIDSTFNSYKMKGHGDIWNPIDNAIAAIRYMFARYGHIVGPGSGGYARGGLVGKGKLPRFAHGGQVILDAGVNMSVGQEPTILGDLKALSSRIGKAVYVISGYRSPSHSAAVGGFSNDPHTRGEAADIGIGSSLRSSASVLTEALLHSVNLDRPFYPASAAEINHVQLWKGGGASGSAKHPIAKVLQGTYTKNRAGATSAAGGTYGQTEVEHYKVFTRKLSFGSLPSKIEDCRMELRHRQQQLSEYRAAQRHVKDPATRQAISFNVKLLQDRIASLHKQLGRLVAARRRETKIKQIEGRGTFPGVEAALKQLERDYNQKQEFADQVVALEPEERGGFTGNFGQVLSAYIEGQEAPAWSAVLGTENTWRNTLLGGETLAAHREDELSAQIHKIESLRGSNPKAWRKQRWRIPPLKKALAAARAAYDPRTGLGSFEEQLESLQGPKGPHDPRSGLPTEPQPGTFGGMIWNTQMSIRELGIKIREALTGGGEGEVNSALLEATKQLAETAQKEKLLAEAQYGPLAAFLKAAPPYIGAFKSGGQIPGSPNQAYTATVHGGETIIPATGSVAAPLDLHLHGDIASLLDVIAPGLAKEVDRRMGEKYRHIRFGPTGRKR